jgi:serine/threonine protein kinase
MSTTPKKGSQIGKCLNDFQIKIFKLFFIDLVKKELNHGGAGFVYVVSDPDTNLEVVLKLIHLGPNESSSRDNHKKMIEKEMKVGILVAKDSSYLISYSEIFEWGDYFCIKMEYCEKGDIQSELDKGRVFTEEV